MCFDQVQLNNFWNLALRENLPDLNPRHTLTFLQAMPGANRNLIFGILDRSRLFELVNDRLVNTPTLCVLILSWGGMRPKHFKTLAQQPMWIGVSEKVRMGRLTRHQAYEAFLCLRKKGHLQGMGPAFFTKLIYFLLPRSNTAPPPHIMDQWVASSMNVLCGQDVINLTALGKARWVSDANTPENYEIFCGLMDKLALRLGVDPHTLDRAMLSKGGHNPHAWRRHVIARRN